MVALPPVSSLARLANGAALSPRSHTQRWTASSYSAPCRTIGETSYRAVSCRGRLERAVVTRLASSSLISNRSAAVACSLSQDGDVALHGDAPYTIMGWRRSRECFQTLHTFAYANWANLF